MESCADAAVIDTRPLFAFFGLDPGEHDRFYSDLGEWEQVQDPWIRDFTKRAREASIPVLLGGHTLVFGGLWVIADAVNQRRLEQKANP